MLMMMSDSDLKLIESYSRHHSEEAFAELVRRHVALVHSAAIRQVRSPQLAEEVVQSTFIKLARLAPQLAPDTILTAWLYQVTRREAIDVVRREARRQLREQVTTRLNATHSASTEWTDVELLLDEAMSDLDETDRAAILLRYFDNKSLREVGQTLGTSDDAAQKRVSRAVERLRDFFIKRGVSVGAGGLVAAISANAVQAAPTGMVIAISAAAALSGSALITTATTTIQTVAMTALQKTATAVSLALLAGVSIYKAHQVSVLQAQIQTLKTRETPIPEESKLPTGGGIQIGRDLASLREENERLTRNSAELLKLRGEVGALRKLAQEKSQAEADPVQSAAKAWLAKVNTLRNWVDQHPEQHIPELQYLLDYDWLDAVKTSTMEGEHAPANAMEGLRASAKRQFAHKLKVALNRFVEENHGELPGQLSQLNAHMDPPMNDAILNSYTLLHSGKLIDIPKNEWLVKEISPPVDDQDDRRMMIRTDDFVQVPRTQ